MSDLTADQIAEACDCAFSSAAYWREYLNDAMREFNINTPQRQAAFLAQISHESARLRYTAEVWGPTPAQEGYEGRKDLGNNQPGDGRRFKGHGLIQTTGRTNHARVRDGLRAMGILCPDFEDYPDELARPEWAALSAGLFWDDHQLNALADAGEYTKIGRAINRGNAESDHPANGEPERLALWQGAKDSLGVA